MSSQELVRLVYQLSSRTMKKDDVILEIRRRGIGFPLTSGIRSIVASKAEMMRIYAARSKRLSGGA
ncbi:MAG: hypothetical protein WKF84_26430 [Pyrinomonadaceae bacterium]